MGAGGELEKVEVNRLGEIESTKPKNSDSQNFSVLNMICIRGVQKTETFGMN